MKLIREVKKGGRLGCTSNLTGHRGSLENVGVYSISKGAMLHFRNTVTTLNICQRMIAKDGHRAPLATFVR